MYGYTTDQNKVSYQEILRRVPQEKVWELAIGYTPIPFQRVTNPFRIDAHPGCWFEWGHTRLFLVDYADKRYHNMTCFDAVSETYGTDFRSTLLLIDEMLDTGIVAGRPAPSDYQRQVKERKELLIGTRRFLKVDRQYWEPFHISSSDLMEDEVMAVRWYKFAAKDGRTIFRKFDNPVNSYAIVFPNQHKKIYNPHLSRTSGKFITDCTGEDIGNWNNIVPGPLLIVTKSYKDHRILKNLGYQVIWMQNEGISLSKENVSQLSQMFDKILLLYDSDKAGKLAAERLTKDYNNLSVKRNFRWSTLPTEKQKDPGEFIYEFGKKALGQEMAKLTHYATQDSSQLLGACIR